MAVSWTDFQTLSDTVEAAFRQTVPETETEYAIYADAITSALADISAMEGIYVIGRAGCLKATEIENYDKAEEQLSKWSIRLRDMLKIMNDLFPLIEGQIDSCGV